MGWCEELGYHAISSFLFNNFSAVLKFSLISWGRGSVCCRLGREEMELKDGAYFCYCAYVLRILKYSGFLWVVPTNTGIFLRGLKLGGKSIT